MPILDKLEQEKWEEASFYVLNRLPTKYPYHNLDHTTGVIEAARQISTAHPISDKSIVETSLYAALFHDLGYTVKYSQNEPEGARLWEEYATTHLQHLTQNIIDVTDAILCTDMKNDPMSTTGEILRDADLYTLGHPYFQDWSDRLRREWQSVPNNPMQEIANDDTSWVIQQYNFIKNHTWFTKEAHDLYHEQHQQNIEDFYYRWEDILKRLDQIAVKGQNPLNKCTYVLLTVS